MAVIGTFVPTKDGGWTGTIRTLLLDVKVRLVPNDNKDSDAAPAFRVFAGESEVGAAWRRRSSGAQPRDYLSLLLQDPAVPRPISAALFGVETAEAQLVWSPRNARIGR